MHVVRTRFCAKLHAFAPADLTGAAFEARLRDLGVPSKRRTPSWQS
jgi:hypothetical protein